MSQLLPYLGKRIVVTHWFCCQACQTFLECVTKQVQVKSKCMCVEDRPHLNPCPTLFSEMRKTGSKNTSSRNVCVKQRKYCDLNGVIRS